MGWWSSSSIDVRVQVGTELGVEMGCSSRPCPSLFYHCLLPDRVRAMYGEDPVDLLVGRSRWEGAIRFAFMSRMISEVASLHFSRKPPSRAIGTSPSLPLL